VHAVIARQGETLLARQDPWLSRIDSVPGIRAWRDYVVSTMRADLSDLAGLSAILRLTTHFYTLCSELDASILRGGVFPPAR
jgi:hypothetical protein